jgi:hypothetical protein
MRDVEGRPGARLRTAFRRVSSALQLGRESPRTSPRTLEALLRHRPQLKDEDYPADAEGSGARQLGHRPDSCAHPTDEDVEAANVQAVGTPEVIHIYALRDAAQFAREARETLS